MWKRASATKVRALILLITLGPGALWSAPSATELRRYLETVVIGSEFGHRDPVIIRWDGEVTWSLSGPRAAEWRSRVEATLNWIDAYTVRICFREVASGGDLAIWCGPQDEWPLRGTIRDGRVAGYTVVHMEGTRITRAFVLLADAGFARAPDRVAREELFQAMGFLNDDPEPNTSITSRDTWNSEFTQLDSFWLIVVYSGRVPLGATAAAAWDVMAALLP